MTVLKKVKILLGAKKAGHTGTLDPLATGVLPICLGKATKISQYLLEFDKSYIFTMKLGISTDSGDSLGRRQCQKGRQIHRYQHRGL